MGEPEGEEEGGDSAHRCPHIDAQEAQRYTSLVNALPSAFAKAPTDRGSFDQMVLSRIEEILKDHLAQLEERLHSGDALKAEKAAAVDQAEAVLNAAKQRQEAAAEACRAADAERREMEAAVRKAQASLKEHEKVMAGLEAAVFVQQAGLELSQENLKAFTSLVDRMEAQPKEAEGSEAPADESVIQS